MDRCALICRTILEQPAITQRELARILNLSLGTANSLIKDCLQQNLIAINNEMGCYEITPIGLDLLQQYKVDGAVILAAGFGSRFVPLTFELPKGLLEVFGERMIERQIKQLQQVGIFDITIMVGYLKEKFEYLIDKYNVKLVYNPEYATKNTLSTFYHAANILKGKNMYLLSSDNWIRDNMFHAYECGSWYSAVYHKGKTSEWCLYYNKKGNIHDIQIGGIDSWVMYGPVFLQSEWSEHFIPLLSDYYKLPGTEQFYWEHVYYEIINGTAARRLRKKIDIPDLYINCQPDDQVYEFENLEELRKFDIKYQTQSGNVAMQIISSVFNTAESDIKNIRCLKAGMTNNSFLFEIEGKQYICRIPGTGTDLLINRKQEKIAFDTIRHLDISENIIYFDEDTGYKISTYYEGANNADAKNWDQVSQCMETLRQFHKASLHVEHQFDIRERISFYEILCENHTSLLFEDYQHVRLSMNQLLDRLDTFERKKILSHIDSVADNFLFLPSGQVRLIDWEYSGMADPLIDIAMFSIYSYYNEDEVNRLIEIYLQRKPSDQERFIIYAYIALSGFLWSLWAIYKSRLGEEFGEYTMLMYRYAKKYWQNCNKIFIL